MKKVLFSVFIVFLFFNNSKAQQKKLKTFSGKYEEGIATYQYYENENYERVYHGNFSYKKESTEFKNYDGIKITGQFNENKKDGYWVFKETIVEKYSVDFPGLTWDQQIAYALFNQLEPYAVYTPLSTPINTVKTQKGKYISGLKDGVWTFVVFNKTKNVKEFYSKVHFRNDTLIGSYYYKNNKGRIVSGQFNDKGYMEGTWKISYLNYSKDKIESIVKYRDGVKYWYLKRNISTGEVLSKYDYSDKVEDLLKGNIVELEKGKFATLKKQINDHDYSVYAGIASWNGVNSGDMLFNIIKKGSTPNKFIPERIIKYLTSSEVAEYKEKERERLELLRKQEERRLALIKRDNYISTGDSLYAKGEYHKALTSYNNAKIIEDGDVLDEKINKTQKFCDNYVKNKDRQYKYANILQSYYDTKKDQDALISRLYEIKKKYGKNYKMCSEYLLKNVEEEKVKVEKFLADNNYKEFPLNYTWSSKDDKINIVLISLEQDILQYSKFYHKVKDKSIDKKDKNARKLLKSSDNPKEIIKNVNNYSNDLQAPDETGEFTDSRDGKVYKWVKIGNQVWMAENLAYTGGDKNNYQQYNGDIGVLYTYSGAEQACPTGWHLPAYKELLEMEEFLEMSHKGKVGISLKSVKGWNKEGNGTDDYGFNAYPTGYRGNFWDNAIHKEGRISSWWSSTFDYRYYLHCKKSGIYFKSTYSNQGNSVRCVKDNKK